MERVNAFILACFVSASIALVAVVLSPPLSHSNQHANTYNTERPSAQKPETSPSPTDHRDKPETGRKHEEHECKYDGPKWFGGFYCFFAAHEKFWISFGTLILAAATIILGVATAFLFFATRALVHGAEETAARQLRAYVHVQNAFVLNIKDPAKREVQIIIENFGQTPALDMTMLVSEHVREWPLQSYLPPTPSWVRFAVAPLPPRGIKKMTVDVSLLNECEEGELQAGRAGIYAWGEIKYHDAFGKDRRTWFCLVCEGPKGLAEGDMHATEEGNGCT